LVKFPKLTIDYISQLTCGIYQLKLAQSYIEQMIDTSGNYKFEVFKEKEDLIRVKLCSRFQSQVKRISYINSMPKLKESQLLAGTVIAKPEQE
jgi:hypothetical protein